MIFEQFEKMEFSYWNSSKICWWSSSFVESCGRSYENCFLYGFSKLNETTHRYFTLVLRLKWHYLYLIVQRSFVLLPYVHGWFCWALVWNILGMLLLEPWWRVIYFKIESGFYLIVHILSFFPCRNWIIIVQFGIWHVFRRIWTLFTNRPIKVPPLKIL